MDDDYKIVNWPPDYFVNAGSHDVSIKIQGHDYIVVPPGGTVELPGPIKTESETWIGPDKKPKDGAVVITVAALFLMPFAIGFLYHWLTK